MSEVQFPIQIGLIGAPGSGKQRLIDEFVAIASDWFEEQGSPLHIVGNAGDVIEATFDQAMGAFGSYVEDLWAFYNRYEHEETLRQEGKTFLSNGTIIDQIAHCGVNMETILSGIATPETQARYQKQQVAMTTLTAIFSDRFRYMFGFYLPYKQGVILPGESDFENHYASRIDTGLQMVFQNFGLRIQVLDQSSFEEKAQTMFETIKEIMENGPKLPEEAAEDLPPVEDVTLAE